MTAAWPFLIARGRRRDYRTVLAPDFLPHPDGPAHLADSLPIGRPDGRPCHSAVTLPGGVTLLVTAAAAQLAFQDGLGDVEDEHGRPLVYLYGLVMSQDDPGSPDAADLAAARAEALASYRVFLADEGGFAGLQSRSRPVPPAPRPPAPPPALSPGQPFTTGTTHVARLRIPVGLVLAGAVAVAVLLIAGIVAGWPRTDTLTDVRVADQSCTKTALRLKLTFRASTAATVELRLDDGDAVLGRLPAVQYDVGPATATLEATVPAATGRARLDALYDGRTQTLMEIEYTCQE